MDTRIFRLCMIWLLIVCVPLQGTAATAQRCCLRVTLSAPAGETPQGLATNHHCHGNEMGATLAVTKDLRPHERTQAHCAAHARCKACAFCAFGVTGVPSTLAPLDIDFTTQTPSVGTSPSFVSHINSGLDRPPKHSFSLP